MKPSNAVMIIMLIGAVCFIMIASCIGILFLLMGNQAVDYQFGASPHTGKIAPDFELKTIDGENIRLQDLRGKAVMVNFWAVRCKPCIQEMPVIQERYQKHYPDLVVLGVEEIGGSIAVRNFIEEAGLSFIILAGNDAIIRRYNIHSYPTSFFIDEGGVIQSVVVGRLSGPALDAELAKIGIQD